MIQIKNKGKKLLERLLARSSVEVCSFLPLPEVIRVTQKLNDIQLSPEELQLVIKVVSAKAPCNFLVFGLGNDSWLWSRINRRGNTVFIEDNKTWFMRAPELARHARVYLVDYLTQRTQWIQLLEHPAMLDMAIPREVEREKWDIILVDAPNGFEDTSPGRMKSIFLSSRLAEVSSDVFVHDCHREVERAYCDRFLKPENLRAKVALMRHYQIVNAHTERAR